MYAALIICMLLKVTRRVPNYVYDIVHLNRWQKEVCREKQGTGSINKIGLQEGMGGLQKSYD